MVRAGMFVFGIGLLVLWLVGLGRETVGWLLWLDFVAGILSVVGGFALTPGARRTARVGEPLALAIGLFALWIAALAAGAVDWRAWWTFAFACAYLLLGIAGGSERLAAPPRPTPRPTPRPV